MYTPYRRNRAPRLLVGALTGLLVLGAGYAGWSALMTERRRPVNYSAQECADKLMNSNNYQINKIPLSWGTRFNVLVNGEKVGTIDEQVLSWGKHFDFYAGNSQKKIGHADERVISFGLVADVFNENGTQIGKLDEKVLKFLDPGHTIRVYDKDGKLLAVSNERALTMTHTTTIYDSSEKNELGGTVEEYFRNNFQVNLNSGEETKPEILDRRFVLALVAMEYELDQREKEQKAEEERKRKKDDKD
ncbi:hypothetical protein HZA97_04030 [Candidatus Woesearchaeota archaeon]|nr:hypothetical protein [Candidatus Woesearchaeota archaeon]